MARNKVKLAWIVNSAARRSTFTKRCRGLKKKLSEISTLCGVDVAMVMYTSPDGQPEVWPNMEEATRILLEFKNCTELEQKSNTMTQETFLSQKLTKLQEKLHKEEAAVREMEIQTIIFEGLLGSDFTDLDIEKAGLVAWALNKHINELDKKLAEQGINDSNISIPSVFEFGQSSQDVNALDIAAPIPNFIGGMDMNMNMVSNSFREPMPMSTMVPSFGAGGFDPTVQVMIPLQQNVEMLQGQNWMFSNAETDVVGPAEQEMLSEHENVEFLHGQNLMLDNMETGEQQFAD